MAAKTAVAVKKQPRELTEEEILKAPEKDYMNDAQLAFFKKRLEEDSRPDPAQRRRHREHLRENESRPTGDRATLEEEYTLELRTRDRERKLLKKVEKSIRLIDDGRTATARRRASPSACRAHGAPDRNAVAGSAGTPRARAKAVRRLIRRKARPRCPRAAAGLRAHSMAGRSAFPLID